MDWSQQVLAARAHVSLSTVKDFEKGRRVPIPNNLEAMRRAIETAGVWLVFDGGGKAAGIAVVGSSGLNVETRRSPELPGADE